VGRARSLVVLFIVVLAALACIPAAASAASLTWDLTHDFTTTVPGANPDKDSYGGHPWSYEKSGQSPLDTFATNIAGSLAGWEDANSAPPYVAINGGTGQAVLQPTTTSPAVVAWTSPVSGTVSVAGSVTADQAGQLLCPNANWSVAHGATTLAAGIASTSPASFSKSVAVNAGERITLAVTVPPLVPPLQTPNCTDTSARFMLQTAAPTITLGSPGAAPLNTPTPTLTGVAAHRTSVRITVYPGDTTDSAPAASATGSSGASGQFSIRLRSLRDGRYTVIASDGTGGISHPVTFRIKVHAPTLTLTDPLAGGHLSQAAPIFTGAAGTALGDAPQVSLQLFHDASTKAKNLGTKSVNHANGSWILNWPAQLALGTYTARVSQADDAGHTSTITRTFEVVPANSAIGSLVTISSAGEASLPVWCTAPSTETCTGTVLILTQQTYRTSGGGLAGRLRVMFAYVSIAGGRTVTVKRQVQADALHALRRARKVPVVVVATLRSANGRARSLGVTRVITVGSARHR
jgi:hypothetical protein